MSREWQPGDVAMLRLKAVADEYVGIFRGADRLDPWFVPGIGYCTASEITNARPLAVVDPEQPIPDEWVRVFREPLEAAWVESANYVSAIPIGLAALFAHIANPQPPKPAEPTGDRATVRDRDGELWHSWNKATSLRWYALDATGEPSNWRTWDQLDIPEDGILWHGVGGDS